MNLNEIELSTPKNLFLNLVLQIPREILLTHKITYINIIKAFGIKIVKIVMSIPLKLKFIIMKVIVNPRVNPFKDNITKVIGENITLVLNKIKTTTGTAKVKIVVFEVYKILKFPYLIVFMYSIKSFLRLVTVWESKYVNKYTPIKNPEIKNRKTII